MKKYWIVFLLGVGCFGLSTSLLAGEKWRSQSHPDVPQAVQDWYANAKLTKPARKRFGFMMCCLYSETVKSKFKPGATADSWLYLDPTDQKWKPVPPDIIHNGEAAPGGMGTLFILEEAFGEWPAGTPTCFWPPRGGF